MKTFVSCIILLAVLSENTLSQDSAGIKYLPLKTGNFWIYEFFEPVPPPLGTRYRFKTAVTKDTLIDGHKYYFVSKSHYVLHNDTANWFRIDSSNGNLLIFKPGINCRPGDLMLVDSLTSQLYDLAQVCASSYDRRKCMQTGSASLFGQQVQQKTFNYEIIASSAFQSYSRNFGITYCYSAETGGYTVTLLGCVLDGTLYGDTTLISLKPISKRIPEQFSLSQNYPNPFNPSTKIKFSIPPSRGARGVITLTIYDILGREVATLVNEQLQPGTYEVEWDASNYLNGVYFYKLTISDPSASSGQGYSETRKMVLVK